MTERPDDVAARWGDAAFTGQLAQLSWMASPVVQMHLNERSTGSPARDWLTAWAPRFFPDSPLRVLVLGCGEGWLERALARRAGVLEIDALDLAPDAVARAREQAEREALRNIRYRVADLNAEEFGLDAYNVIIAHSVLHHVERLEHAFAAIDAALRPDGTFLMNEYVGPRRFQFGDDVLAIMNDLLRAIPERYRRGTIQQGVYHEKLRATAEEIAASDPSEAVRSDELLLMTAARFEIVDWIDLGGTVLQHLLYDIIPNFRMDDPVGRSILELLCIAEGVLVDRGAIVSDFALVAAQKKGTAPRAPRRVTLPPLPPEARVTVRDPLGFGPKRFVRAGDRQGPWHLDDWMLRALRSALLAQARRRTALNPDSTLHGAIERLRYALRRDRAETGFDHVMARLPADSELLPLLGVVGTRLRA